jgi:AcrR family transcriptional regulator
VSPRPHIEHIRKPQILTAAAEVIAERGIGATRIADVAERAGTSAGGVLYWFSSKEDLLTQALIRDEEDFNERLTVRLAEVSDPAAKMLAVIDACVEDHDWTLWMELWTRALHDGELRAARQALEDRWRSTVSRVIRAGAQTGVFTPVNSDEAALALAALIDGLAVQVTLGDATLNRGYMRRICIDAAERLLGVELEPLPLSASENGKGAPG